MTMPVNVNPHSETDAASGAISGGDLFLGGNPNLALIGRGGSSLPWLIGAGLAFVLAAVWLWKR